MTADCRIANGKDVIERQHGVRLVRLGHVAGEFPSDDTPGRR
jgi:hypothetical protein